MNERHENEPLLVVVPTESPLGAIIDPHSGIVGYGTTGDRVRVFYESNRFGFANVNNYADKCAIAASRAVTNYPTVASATPLRDEVHVIGVFDRDAGRVILTEGKEALLASWLDLPLEELDAQLTTTSVIR
ncbi:MAG TPA: hypothetical protein VHD87_12790 [Acidimicrobiales bacterium]|nr:hypothetical protein [Acidimicrobiales bacterium]